MTSHEGDETEDEVVLELRELMRLEADQTRALPGDSLKDTDERTQAAVHWLQAAWAEESSRGREDPAPLPAWTQRAPSPSRRVRRLAVVAAALAAAALAAMILPHPTAEPPESPGELPLGDVTPYAVTTFEGDRFEGDRFALSKDRMELVTGRVRVILLQPQVQHETPR